MPSSLLSLSHVSSSKSIPWCWWLELASVTNSVVSNKASLNVRLVLMRGGSVEGSFDLVVLGGPKGELATGHRPLAEWYFCYCS